MKMTGTLLRGHMSGVLALLLVASVLPAAAVPATNTPHTTVATARQMLTRQAYADALDTLNAVLDKHPDNGEARFLKGLALAHSGKTEAALALFEALTADFPDMAEAWNNLGVLRARADNLAGAREALQKAVSLNPEHVAARQNLGDVYVALARQAYLDASALAPDNRVVRRKIDQLARLMRGDIATDRQVAVSNDQGSAVPAPGARPQVRSASEQPAPAGANTTPTRVASVGMPEISTAAQNNAQVAVRSALRDWAAAWSAQDLGAYFAAYGQHFDPVGSRTIQQWRALRVRRVSSPEWISVEVSNIEVAFNGTNTATVHFQQDYESGSYRDHVRKTVTMTRSDQGWVITTESG